MNLQETLNSGKELLSIYFTAGFPQLNSTGLILKELENAGADLVEIGMPYSDPMADGETIQHSSKIALENGMTIKLLFKQLQELKDECKIPVVLMGYLNPVLQFGLDNFLQKCGELNIQSLIIPDITPEIFESDFKEVFEAHGIKLNFLITPQTPVHRIKRIDELGSNFIYVVSSQSITGSYQDKSSVQNEYFQRIKDMNLKTPRLIGFGIYNRQTFENACLNAQGAIIGSEFIRKIEASKNLPETIRSFVSDIRGDRNDI